MSPTQKLRLFMTERLNEVHVQILDIIDKSIDKSIAKYEQEATLSQEVIARQHALLRSLNKPLMEQPSSGESEPEYMSISELGSVAGGRRLPLSPVLADSEAPPTLRSWCFCLSCRRPHTAAFWNHWGFL